MLNPIRSHRVAGLEQSDIRAMTQRCRELGGINLGQGICDTPPPHALIDSVMPAIESGKNIYTRFDGAAALRKAISNKLYRYNGIEADPENEVIVTVGATGAFAAICMALCNPGDRILLFEPYYGYHLNTAHVAGLDPTLVPLKGDDFSLDIDALEEKADGARAIVVNTPGNPSGRVFTRKELEEIARICKHYNLLCITDEIYEYFLFDDRAHISLATLPGMRERTVTISGYSKTFSITGWRIGYLTACRELAQPVGLVNDLYYACAASPLQYAVAHAIHQLGDDYYQNLARDYQHKRDNLCAALQSAGLTPRIPEGAYYVLADITPMGCKTSKEAAIKLLEKTGVAGVPGSAFFSSPEGERVIRFCFGRDDKTLDQAGERLQRLL